jgi:hypothetical protein
VARALLLQRRRTEGSAAAGIGSRLEERESFFLERRNGGAGKNGDPSAWKATSEVWAAARSSGPL